MAGVILLAMSVPDPHVMVETGFLLFWKKGM
jgi:hypothetical protein